MNDYTNEVMDNFIVFAASIVACYFDKINILLLIMIYIQLPEPGKSRSLSMLNLVQVFGDDDQIVKEIKGEKKVKL